MKKTEIVLASGSPRRIEYLKQLGVDFLTVIPDIEEKLNPKLPIEKAVVEIAKDKAYAVSKCKQNTMVMAFDTVVVLDGVVLGKPKNSEEAVKMLAKLSGQTHRVITGCAIVQENSIETFHSQAEVTFNRLSCDEIKSYVDSNNVLDKAGAYAIQGEAAKFVVKTNGDYHAIIGFPLNRIYKFLQSKSYL